MSSVKAFFSGVEGKSHFDACVVAGVRHVLTSYLYLEKRKDPEVVKRRKKAHPEMLFMVDSGAHTFITDYGKFSSWSKQDFENYLKGYCDWLLKYKDYVFCAVEFDIDYTLNMLFGGGQNSTVGSSIVTGWQDKYFRPLQEKGVDICFVWHTERKLEGWEEMCSKFAYVGLPGEMSSDADFNKYMSVARRYGAKIHGFAATKQADFRDWPWFSVDSITWKTCEMYGTLIHWDAHKQLLIFDQNKANRVKYRRNFEQLGLDADGIINDTNYKEVTKYALHSMRSMEEFYEKKYTERLMYYDLRLPHPRRIMSSAFPQKEMMALWKLMRPPTLFKNHAGENNPNKIRDFLAALSCVQNKDYNILSGLTAGKTFLTDYFPKLTTPMVEEVVFQKELAAYVAPSNPPALRRSELSHYHPNQNHPKKRDALNQGLDDLLWHPEDYPGKV